MGSVGKKLFRLLLAGSKETAELPPQDSGGNLFLEFFNMKLNTTLHSNLLFNTCAEKYHPQSFLSIALPNRMPE